MNLLSSPDLPITMRRFLPRGVLFVWLFGVLCLWGWPNTLYAAPLAQTGCSASMDVSNTSELNNAINCYNSRTTEGTSTINFTNDITLDAASTVINNNTPFLALQINGNDKTLSGANTYRGLEINPNTRVLINDLTIRDGKAATNGGGIWNSGTLSVSGSTLISNTAQMGGGIWNSGTLTVGYSKLSGNSVITDGGGIYNQGTLTVAETMIRGNSTETGFGGGISSQGPLTVTKSTLSGNSAAYSGGGIHSESSLVVDNSTISGNSAQLGGGAIISVAPITVTGSILVMVTNSTISGNSATSGFGDGILNYEQLVLRNTIIANSPHGDDCHHNGLGTIISQTHNLIEDSAHACGIADGANGSIVGQDPALAPLALNADSGLENHALLATSPAIDHGDAATCAAAPINNLDQNGASRPVGAACDIGAVEYAAHPVVCNFPATVSTTAELNNAIACYNSQTFASFYAIFFNADITLDAASTIINNTNPGLRLHIGGNNKTLNGANTYRGLEINPNTIVSIENLAIRDGKATTGGGILNHGTVTNSSFISNTTQFGNGGGIRNLGTLGMSNSTFSNNSAQAFGGGILNGGILTVTNSTFSANSAQALGGGGIYVSDLGELTLRNTIIANSGGSGDCVNTLGTLTGQSHNLIEDSANACGIANDANGSIIGQDPALAPLAFNGGSGPLTYALLAASPAINKGDAAICAAAPVNNLAQNGVVRPFGAGCDIGAVEYLTCTFPAAVSTTTELNDALSCYNIQTTAGVYTINFNADITLDTASRIIKNSNPGVALQINGNNRKLSGANTYRGLTIDDFQTDVTIAGLTIRDGKADTNSGGIDNNGTLTLNNSQIISNSGAFAGGIYNSSSGNLKVTNSTISANKTTDKGGGIYNDGTLTVSNSTLSNNLATNKGGGIYNDSGIFGSAVLTVTNSTLNANTSASSGGIANDGKLTLRNTIIANSGGGGDCVNNFGTLTGQSHNLIEDSANACGIANDANGSIIGQDPALAPLAFNGGSGPLTHALLATSPAIDKGDAAICAAAPINNLDQIGVIRPQGAGCDIGAVEYLACTFPAAVSTTTELNNALICYNTQTTAGVYAINFNADITLAAASTVINNPTPGVALQINGNNKVLRGANTYRGFGIAPNTNVTIAGLIIRDGQADPNGGGIDNSGTLTLNNSTISGNTATSNGGGINNNGTLTLNNSTVRDNQGQFAGGMNNFGTLTLNNSTISGNTATASGGGLYNLGTLTVGNSTFSNNTATGNGGAINNFGPLTLNNSTISGNTANSGGGINNNDALTLNNTIIANSGGGGDCVNSDKIKGQTHNLIEDSANACGIANGANGSIIGQDPALAPLTIGSGPQTHPLLAASPAIDKGDAAICAAAPINNRDQLGVIRPQGAACDIGAVESIPLSKRTLTVNKTGSGFGGVKSNTGGLDCGATCVAVYDLGTTVTLTATPGTGSTFAGWSGACSGTATCAVTLDNTKTVTATFNKTNALNQTLTVSKAGAGTGKITSSPAGIDCGATCSVSFPQGATVTLTAAPDTGSTFAGWSDACSGTTSTCTVTLDSAKTVTATFNRQTTAEPQKIYLPVVHR